MLASIAVSQFIVVVLYAINSCDERFKVFNLYIIKILLHYLSLYELNWIILGNLRHSITLSALV